MTAGEWTIDDQGPTHGFAVLARENAGIAEIVARAHVLENAVAIAALPKLVSACRAALEYAARQASRYGRYDDPYAAGLVDEADALRRALGEALAAAQSPGPGRGDS